MPTLNSQDTTKRKRITIKESDDEDEEEIQSNPSKSEKKMEDNNHNRENRYPIQRNIIDLKQGSSSSESSLPIQKHQTKTRMYISSLFTPKNKDPCSVKKSPLSSHVKKVTTLQNGQV
jgi:hypothetical protein